MKGTKFFFLGLFLLGIGACKFVTAQDKMIFEPTLNWQYLGKVAPGLEKKIRFLPLLDTWVGDPKKLKVIKINNFGQQSPIYLVDTTVGYPQRIDTVNDRLDDYYRPLCNRSGECTFLIYKQTPDGYSLIFDEQIAFVVTDNWFRFSNTLYQNYPQCFEAIGYDRTRREAGQIPESKEGYQLVTRYCYDGNTYKFNQIYLEKINPEKS